MPVKKSVKKTAPKKRTATAAKAAAKPRAKKPAERELVSFDFALKYLLRAERDYVVLNGFLSELLGQKVEVKSLDDVENIKEDKDDKTNRVDMRAQINGGEIVLFEIQFIQEFDFLGRVLFGVSSAIVDQVKAGKFYNIQKIYSVIVAYSNLNAKREYLFSGEMNNFHGVHYKDELIPFSQAIAPKSKTMVDIHPEYYLILPRMFDEQMRGLFDEWVYVLKRSAVRDDFKAAGIKEAKAKLDYLRMTPEQKKAYKRYLEKRRSAESAIQTAEGKGELRGIQKGRQEGLQEGLQKGRQEGRQEGQELECAKHVKSLYKTGFTVKQIAKGLELSETAVKRILGL